MPLIPGSLSLIFYYQRIHYVFFMSSIPFSLNCCTLCLCIFIIFLVERMCKYIKRFSLFHVVNRVYLSFVLTLNFSYGNRYIYKVLDFSRPRMSLMVQLASILGTVAIAVIYQLLFMLRLYIYSRTNRRDQQQSSPPPPSSEEPPSKKKNKV